MLVCAKVKMVHANALREPGETFPWTGPVEPPSGLCEKVNGKPGKDVTNMRGGKPYAASMDAVQAGAPVK